MKSRAQIMGHPIHPMLVAFPSALYTISFLFDVAFLATGHPFWYRAAFWNMLLGFAGNIAAAIPGIVDLLGLPPGTEARKIGRRHAAFGVVLALVYLMSLLLRGGGIAEANQTPWGPIFLNLIGMLILPIQGWLGGHLVFHFGVGVSSGDSEAGKK